MSMPDHGVLIGTDPDEINEVVASPKQRTRRWAWRLGITMVVMSAMGMVGHQVLTFQRKRANTPLEHLSWFQDKLMAAFSHQAMRRALADPVTFRASSEFLLAQEDQGEPSAMGMFVELNPNVANNLHAVQVVATFLAQEGKGALLLKKLQDTWDGVVAVQAAMAPPAQAEMMKQMVEIQAGGTDEVVLTVKLPKEPAEEEAELKEALKAHQPRFSANVSFGHTLGEMYADGDSTIVAQVNGFHAVLSTAFANTLFSLMCPPHEGAACQLLAGISRYSSSQKIFYTSKDAVDTQMFPSFQGAVTDTGFKLRQNIPPAVLEPLKGIGSLSQGIKSIVAEGLPYDWQVKLTFRHFHPYLVLSAMLNGDDPRVKFLENCQTAEAVDTAKTTATTVSLCSNSCMYPNDGDCDDGGPGKDYSSCALGTDCNDCGSREEKNEGTATAPTMKDVAACKAGCEAAAEKGILYNIPYEMRQECETAMYGPAGR